MASPSALQILNSQAMLAQCRDATAGLVLDLLAALNGNPTAAAVNLGVSTTAVIKLLGAEPRLWAAANPSRADAGQPALAHRR